jgi:hypothetical protein
VTYTQPQVIPLFAAFAGYSQGKESYRGGRHGRWKLTTATLPLQWSRLADDSSTGKRGMRGGQHGRERLIGTRIVVRGQLTGLHVHPRFGVQLADYYRGFRTRSTQVA